MFEFLFSASVKQVINVANQAIRLIEWRSALDEHLSQDSVAAFDKLSPNELKLTLRVVKEIEATEKVSLTNLSDSTADKYLSKLSEVASNHVSKTLSPDDIKRGRQILKTWKNEPPSSQQQAASRLPKYRLIKGKIESSNKKAPAFYRIPIFNKHEEVQEIKRLGSLSFVELKEAESLLRNRLRELAARGLLTGRLRRSITRDLSQVTMRLHKLVAKKRVAGKEASDISTNRKSS